MKGRMTREEFDRLSAETPIKDDKNPEKMSKEDFYKLVNEVDSESQSSEPQKSLKQRLKDIGSSAIHGGERLLQGGSNIGSSLAQHIFNLGEGTANIPNMLSGGYIPKFSGHFEVPQQNPSSPESQITENLLKGAEYGLGASGLAELGMAGAKKIPGVSNAVERLFKGNALQKANSDIFNHLNSSSNRLSSLENDINQTKSTADDFLKQSKFHADTNKNLTNQSLDNSKNIIEKLLHGQELGREYSPIVNEVKNIHKTQLGDYRKEMDLFKEAASKNWFLKGEDPSSFSLLGKSPNDVNRIKEAGKITDSILSEAKSLPRKPAKLKGAIDKFKQNPSFDNVHELQSILGESGSSLASSLIGSEKNLGGQYLSSRNSIKDLIKTALDKSDPALGKKYSEMSDRYLENIVPFKTNVSLNKLLTKRGAQELGGENISKILSGEDAASSNVFNRLSDKSKDLLLAQRLGSVIKKFPGKDLEVDPNKLINELKKLPKERADKFLTESSAKDFSNLKDNVDLASSHKDLHDISNMSYKDLSKQLNLKERGYERQKDEIQRITDYLQKNKEKLENKRAENIKNLKTAGIGFGLGLGGIKGYDKIRQLLSGE